MDSLLEHLFSNDGIDNLHWHSEALGTSDSCSSWAIRNRQHNLCWTGALPTTERQILERPSGPRKEHAEPQRFGAPACRSSR